MTTLRNMLLGALVALLTACGTGQGGEGDTSAGSQDTLNAGAQPGELDDNGTELTATAEVTATTCTSETEAQVSLGGTVGTTGSVDSVIITAAIDGGDRVELTTLLPQDFEHEGRDKTATYAVDVTLPNGTHTVELCFTQSGSQGREPKTTCATPISVVIDCTPPEQNVCAEAAPFGDIVGNPSLCKGNGTPHVPVHVRGDFGEEASLSISGPNGFTHTAGMRHAGESCNYHYNWDTQDGNHGGAGTYTFTVTGNGQTLTFTAELHCPGTGNGGGGNGGGSENRGGGNGGGSANRGK
jgi:hypothetical protein